MDVEKVNEKKKRAVMNFATMKEVCQMHAKIKQKAEQVMDKKHKECQAQDNVKCAASEL